MGRDGAQATALVFGAMLAFVLIVVAMHWHDGQFQPDAKGPFLAVEGLD